MLKLSSCVASISRHCFDKASIIWNNFNFLVFENSSFRHLQVLSFPSLSKICLTKFKPLSDKLAFYQFVVSYWTRWIVKLSLKVNLCYLGNFLKRDLLQSDLNEIQSFYINGYHFPLLKIVIEKSCYPRALQTDNFREYIYTF